MQLRRAMWGVVLWIGATAMAAANPVSPGGSVVDMAGVLEADTMLQLDSTLTSYASATGFTFHVVTVSDLADEALEEYARLSLLSHIAAQGDFDVRVALLIWSSARQFLIAISPGFGNELSQTEVAAVMQNQVLPQVTTGDVSAGMLHGVYGLMVAAGEPSDETGTAEELVVLSRWTEDSADEASAADALSESAGSADTGASLDGWMQAMGDDPAATLSEGWSQAQTQWQDVRARLGAMATRAVDSPGAHTPAIIAAVVALAVLAGIWGATRSLAAVAVLLGLGIAAACWVLLGYAELAVTLALSGLAIGIGLQLLPALTRNAHEERLQPSPYSPMKPMPPPAQRPQAAARSWPLDSKPAAPAAPAPTPMREARESDRPASSGARSTDHGFPKALARAHRSGIQTPMLDYLIANKDQLKASAATRKQQRQFWLFGIVMGFFVFLPLGLLLLIVWIAREVAHLKPAQMSLSTFVRQLIDEVRAVSRFQKPGA